MPYTLRTFGGLALAAGREGEVLAEHRRKPLALLAVLAVLGDQGISRDKMGAYLWPEGDAERVRGVLKQTIYALKRDLGESELLLGGTELRLNPSVVDSDIRVFQAAVEAGNSADAVRQYRGPFLDGFHLTDAPLFERWVDDQRDRLGRQFAAQIELLALSAMGRNEPRVAADWWLRLTEQDPLDVRAVSGLIHACLEARDRPGAIRYAERHISLLRTELEITPDPEIRRLVEQARARPASRLDSA